jgi:hypothetical protein
MNALKGISIALLMIGALGLVGMMDLEDEIKQDEHYCEMRQLWENNKHIDANVRPGWPNFKPEVTCQ